MSDKQSDQTTIALVMSCYMKFRGFYQPWSSKPFDPTVNYWDEFQEKHDNDYNNVGTNPCMRFRKLFKTTFDDDQIPDRYKKLFIDYCEPENRYPNACRSNPQLFNAIQ